MLMKLINNLIKCKFQKDEFFVKINIIFSSGYNIGVRLIDDFLARNPNINRCHDFRDTAEILSKVKSFI